MVRFSLTQVQWIITSILPTMPSFITTYIVKDIWLLSHPLNRTHTHTIWKVRCFIWKKQGEKVYEWWRKGNSEFVSEYSLRLRLYSYQLYKFILFRGLPIWAMYVISNKNIAVLIYIPSRFRLQLCFYFFNLVSCKYLSYALEIESKAQIFSEVCIIQLMKKIRRSSFANQNFRISI